MSITDELRGIADTLMKNHMQGGEIKSLKRGLIGCADRIDAEHEAACAEAYGNGVQSVALPDMTAYVKLPVDADGETIRVGDEVVDEIAEVDEFTASRKVTSLYLANDGWWVYIGGIGRRPVRYRHHHAPTVEDVLTKFGIDWEYETNCEDRAALLAEYAAKLRLAGDAE